MSLHVFVAGALLTVVSGVPRRATVLRVLVGRGGSSILPRGGCFRGTDSRPVDPVHQDVVDITALAVLCRWAVEATRPALLAVPRPCAYGELGALIFDAHLKMFVASTRTSSQRLLLRPLLAVLVPGRLQLMCTFGHVEWAKQMACSKTCVACR